MRAGEGSELKVLSFSLAWRYHGGRIGASPTRADGPSEERKREREPRLASSDTPHRTMLRLRSAPLAPGQRETQPMQRATCRRCTTVACTRESVDIPCLETDRCRQDIAGCGHGARSRSENNFSSIGDRERATSYVLSSASSS